MTRDEIRKLIAATADASHAYAAEARIRLMEEFDRLTLATGEFLTCDKCSETFWSAGNHVCTIETIAMRDARLTTELADARSKLVDAQAYAEAIIHNAKGLYAALERKR